jgi:cytochrome P450
MTLLASTLSFLSVRPHEPLILAFILYFSLRTLYRVFLHPLSHIPGPWHHACTSIPLNFHAYNGTECTAVHYLHRDFGPIVRVGPNDVDIADGDALEEIYVKKGGFRKAGFYANFDIDGHKSIFSEVIPEERMARAKAVLPLFSTGSLRAGSDIIYKCVDQFVERVKAGAKTGRPVDMLNLSRSLATDAVSAYLFRDSYGGLDELGKELSASGMVNTFVAVGKFWYLPSWAFKKITSFQDKNLLSESVISSLLTVDRFVSKVVSASIAKQSQSQSAFQQATSEPQIQNYPTRLLAAGFSPSEVRAQCKDLIFAGTDSTGMNLATICHELAKHPACYEKLHAEITAAQPINRDTDLQSLPYLRGVIQEGLRLSMANPSRLPRVVPPEGWTFKGTFFPPGTIVACAPYELHLNSAVFSNALEFQPERWAEPSEAMRRDAIPFGLGTRQCIARNLASMELYAAVVRLVEGDVLRGAGVVEENVVILEWFNSKVVDERIELVWKK